MRDASVSFSPFFSFLSFVQACCIVGDSMRFDGIAVLVSVSPQSPTTSIGMLSSVHSPFYARLNSTHTSRERERSKEWQHISVSFFLLISAIIRLTQDCLRSYWEDQAEMDTDKRRASQQPVELELWTWWQNNKKSGLLQSKAYIRTIMLMSIIRLVRNSNHYRWSINRQKTRTNEKQLTFPVSNNLLELLCIVFLQIIGRR